MTTNICAYSKGNKSFMSAMFSNCKMLCVKLSPFIDLFSKDLSDEIQSPPVMCVNGPEDKLFRSQSADITLTSEKERIKKMLSEGYLKKAHHHKKKSPQTCIHSRFHFKENKVNMCCWCL